MVPIASLVRDELEKKRAELARLKLRLVRRERELARLRAELPEFEAAYLRVVGFRIAELERIEAHIAEAVAEIRPNGASAGGNDSNRGRTNDTGEVAVRAPRIVRRGGSARVTTLNFEPNRGYSLLHLDVTHCNVSRGSTMNSLWPAVASRTRRLY